ncbi:hypothetical protein [Streptomyces sp. NRRL B-24484]|uniref:hypothetical protein n=1 Tax=Streptomyces sp. NRRL B-24484 TaxID=1463833 RepID=UPI00099826AC|nr:hypothetical protein [Streptomyces sp. NRRL B-24484]
MQQRRPRQFPVEARAEHRADQVEVLVVDPHHPVLPVQDPGLRLQPAAGRLHRAQEAVRAEPCADQHPPEQLGPPLVSLAHLHARLLRGAVRAAAVRAAVQQQLDVAQRQAVVPRADQPRHEVADELLALIGQQLGLQRRVDEVAVPGRRLGRVEPVQQAEVGEVVDVEHPGLDGAVGAARLGEQDGGVQQVAVEVPGVGEVPGAGPLEVLGAGQDARHEGLVAVRPAGGGVGGAAGGPGGPGVAGHRRLLRVVRSVAPVPPHPRGPHTHRLSQPCN